MNSVFKHAESVENVPFRFFQLDLLKIILFCIILNYSSMNYISIKTGVFYG